MRKFLLKTHLYAGMAAGLVLLAIGGSGCLLAFEKEIDHLLYPSLWKVTPGSSRVPLATVMAEISKTFPRTRVASFVLPPRDDLAYVANTNRGVQIFVDPNSGRILGNRSVRDGLMSKVRQVHARLLLGKPGEQIVGYSSLVMVAISITGLYLWWPRKALTIPLKARWRRINFDLHQVSGFYCSLVILILSLTGCVITFSETAIPLIFKVTGDPPPTSALPSYTIPDGTRPISVERLIDISNSVLREARTTLVQVPRVNGDVYVEVTKRLPGDENFGQCTVFVNQYSGEIVRVDDSRTAPPGTKALGLNRAIHFGDVFELPSRIAIALASFGLVLQVISGFVIWLIRQKWMRKAVPKRSSLEPQLT